MEPGLEGNCYGPRAVSCWAIAHPECPFLILMRVQTEHGRARLEGRAAKRLRFAGNKLPARLWENVSVIFRSIFMI